MVLLIDELHRDTKAFGHVLEGEGAVGLEKLCVRLDAHFSDEVPGVGSEVAVTFELLLHPYCVQVCVHRINTVAVAHYNAAVSY